MKTALLFLALITAFPSFANHQSVEVKVNGMVCSFCSQGIEKKFAPHADKVHVDLENKVVHLVLKHDEQLTDEKIKELITESGYNVVSIQR